MPWHGNAHPGVTRRALSERGHLQHTRKHQARFGWNSAILKDNSDRVTAVHSKPNSDRSGIESAFKVAPQLGRSIGVNRWVHNYIFDRPIKGLRPRPFRRIGAEID